MTDQEFWNKTGIKKCVIEEIMGLAQKYDVQKVILFGSRARGDYKARSDIDLAFQGGKGIPFIFDVEEQTSTLLQFDIIDLNSPVQSELLESIKREGITIYEKV